MISLKKTLDQIELREKQLEAAFQAYLSAISSAERHTITVHKDLAQHHRVQLRNLHRRIRQGPELGTLAESTIALDRELKSYCDRSSALLEQRERDVKEIIGTVADAASTLTAHNQVYSNRLGRFAWQLESIAHLDDLGQIRFRLTEQVGELKSCLEEIRRENQASVDKLRDEIRGFRERLARAETLASTDPLTGIANRFEGERNLDEHVQAGKRFCVLLFDLNNFKAVNDRWGHQVGDSVLKTFARRLSYSVRPSDIVCRWGGDEFLVILPGCSMSDALNRLKELTEKCAGEYSVVRDGTEVGIRLTFSVGVAESRPGENGEELFRRADDFLYREKGLAAVR